MLMKKRSLKNKGQICYIVQDSDIKSVELIKITATNICIVKDIETNKEQYIHSILIYDTEEEAYKYLLTNLKYYKEEAEDNIKDLKEEIISINQNIKRLKQKYEKKKFKEVGKEG